MENEKYINNSIKRECNVLYNFLNPTKFAGTKNIHYSPILQGCMNTRSGREKLKKFRILLDSGSSLTIVMVKLTSKLKSKEAAKHMLEIQAGKFTTSKKANIEFFLPDFSAT